jgi:glucuronoarabinoxylan endo-1,4-beta-xylanase
MRGYGSFERGSLFVSSSLAALCLLVAPEVVAQVLVDADQEYQTIDGFGASSAFFSESITPAQAEFLFSKDSGIGLSLLRVRINHQDGDTTDLNTAQKAQAWGAKIWAAPWTPPPEWKTNGILEARVEGEEDGRLIVDNYGDFASYLADFAEYMAENDVQLTAITPQNEPDWPSEWPGCLYTPDEMVTFIRDYLGPEFEARGLDDTLIFAPDTAHLKNLPSFADALVADAEALGYIDGISTHPYSQNGDVFDTSWSLPRDNGLRFWQTEISWERFFENPTPAMDTPDPGMKTALWMGKMLHEHITELQVNAWSYWNLIAVAENYDNDRQNPALIQDGVIFKRAYVLGNYSKFVRPGAVRIEAPAEPATDVYVSAYKQDERVTIVAINDGTSASSQDFTLQGQLAYPIIDVVPWVTSDTLALEAQAALTMTDGSFSFELPAKSVTSIVVTLDAPIPVGTGGTSGAGGSGTGGATDGAGGAGGADAAGGTGAGATSGTGGAPSGAGGGVVGAGGDAAVVGAGGTGTPGPTDAIGCACKTTSHVAAGTASKWALALLGLGAIFARRRFRSA